MTGLVGTILEDGDYAALVVPADGEPENVALTELDGANGEVTAQSVGLEGTAVDEDARAWQQYQNDPQNSGQHDGWAPRDGIVEQWTFDGVETDEGSGIIGTPVVSSPDADGNRTVIVTREDGAVIGLDARSGEFDWVFFARDPETDEPITVSPSAPAVADGTVYVIIQTRLIALDADAGTIEWTHTLLDDDDSPGDRVTEDRLQEAAPTVVDGTVYAPGPFPQSDDSEIVAVDAETGSQQWRSETTDDNVPRITDSVAPPAVEDDILYASGTTFTEDDTIAWNASTGDRIWRGIISGGLSVAGGDKEDGGTAGRDFTPALTVDGDQLVAARPAQSLAEMGRLAGPPSENREPNPDDVYEIADLDTDLEDEDDELRDNIPIGTSPVVDGQIAYTGVGGALEILEGDIDPSLGIIAVDRESGEEAWAFDIEEAGVVEDSPSHVEETLVFGHTGSIGDRNGAVYGVDTGETPGQELWRFEVEGGVSTAPAVVDGTVYVGTDEGTVYALTADRDVETTDSGGTTGITIPRAEAGDTFRATIGSSEQLDSLELTYGDSATSQQLDVDVTDEVPRGVPEPPASAEAAVRIEDGGIDSDAVESGRFRFDLDPDSFDDPQLVSVFRFTDGEWESIPTDHRGGTTFEAETPGFSTFVIGQGDTADAPDTDPTDDEISSGGSSTGTSSPTSVTAGQTRVIDDIQPAESGTTVTFTQTALDAIVFDADINDGTAGVSELDAVPTDAPPFDPNRPVVTALEIDVPDSVANESATLEIFISTDALEQTDLDADDIAVLRALDDEYEELATEATVVDDTVLITADTPGFSTFIVANSEDDPESEPEPESEPDSDTEPELEPEPEPELEPDSDPDGESESGPPEEPPELPGFGIGAAVVALLIIAVLAARRASRE
ncbi:MAG: PQQ-binding-like beta-propeller repeat protein [Natronomonas sp.]